MRRYRLIYTALATFAALAVIVSGVAYAASVFTKTIDASVNITGSAGLSFYSNSSATSPITSLSYGDVAQNASGSVTFYVKNTGTVTQTLSAGTSTLPSSVGTVSMTFDGLDTKPLAVNAVARVVATIQTASSASVGSTSFTISVDGTSGSGTTTTPTTTTTTTTTTATPISYATSVAPAMAVCKSCHSGGTSPRLDSYTTVRAQVVPGDATNSRLYQSLVGTGGRTNMSAYATAAQIATIRDWINSGANP